MVPELLLLKLPAYRGKWVMVKRRQRIGDIISEVLQAHKEYARQYDEIAVDFLGNSDEQTLRNLFVFLKDHVTYDEEPETEQVIKTPGAIIYTGIGDCKSYALFIGGVLDALNRKGAEFDACFMFASYSKDRTPGHVFIEAKVNGNDYWIDPVLSRFDQRSPQPTYVTKKSFSSMALYKLSGVQRDIRKVGRADDERQCVVPYESLDEQMMRLTKCSPTGGGAFIPTNGFETQLYELPSNGDALINAPVDAIPMNPGEPVTMQPQPASSDGTTPSTVLPNDPASAGGGAGEWIKKNPLLTAGMVGLVLYAMAKRKKRGR